jgi:glycosyltransferase involved in cell wall biosynthesis
MTAGIEAPGEGGPLGNGLPLRVAQWVRIRWWNACAWYAVTLAEALARRGHASYVLAPPGTPAAREAAARGLPLPDVGDPGGASPLGLGRDARRLRRFLASERIQLVNVHSGPGHALLALLCLRLGIPLVRTRGDIRPPHRGPLQRWLYRRGTTHHLAAASFIEAEHYGGLVPSRGRVTVLRGGIDTARLDRISRPEARALARVRLGLPAATPLVGMIGRLSPVKGHTDFLNAMARIARERRDLHLVIAGPEAQLSPEDLREIARAQGLEERTHVLGRVDDPLAWAAALDVAVIASIDSEAICRSAFEYLGLGIPLVATRVHAIPEIVVEGAGLLVPPGDPERLAAAVGYLLEAPEVRESFSRAGKEHVRAHYALERFGEHAERLFRRLVAEGSAR